MFYVFHHLLNELNENIYSVLQRATRTKKAELNEKE